ncbi:7 transmembrane sweet-taste receptor of 3 GCPR [Nitzschia inconspicua]|uniref:7 transmembrane sweet-taste receptor of 3 GCPR n=1 Tax=Nitzschia inconspicua TaxID=303405 RepID=A0A9K3K746_9STRA|nr:7 transmembrane sweet-taste receptor of 3 GCPR [Nitzschia inconspicua]
MVQDIQRRRRAQEVPEEEMEPTTTTTTTSNTDDDTMPLSEPILLNTLTLNKALWESQRGDNFAKPKGENKLEVYTDPITGRTTAICHLACILPFTRNTEGNIIYVDVSYEMATASMLAVQHLNTGNGSIIPELEGLSDRCPIRFSIQYFDTKFDIGTALKQVIALTHPQINTTDETGTLDEGVGYKDQIPPCAFWAPRRPLSVDLPASLQVSTILFNCPHNPPVPIWTTETSTHGLRGPSPQMLEQPKRWFLFLLNELHLDYIAVLNINDSFGNDYVTNIRDVARHLAPNMTLLQIPLDHDPTSSLGEEEILEAFHILKQSQILYCVVVLLETESHHAFMSIAAREGLAGTGKHNFIFTDGFDAGSLTNRVFDYNSTLHRAYSGAGIIRASGGSPGELRYDKLSDSLRQIKQSESDVLFATSFLPGDPSRLTNSDEFFGALRSDSTSFFFDATVLMGLAACDAVTQDVSLTGTSLYNQIPQSTFQGITGKVVLDPVTKSRIPSSTRFQIWNLVDVVENDTVRKVKFQPTVTHLFSEGEWIMKRSFVFSDGTANLPDSLLPPTVDRNHIHTGTRVIVLLFCAISIVSAIYCAVWTWYNRNKRIVRASQPFFLCLLCSGTIVLASTIIPMSFDGGNLSMDGLNRSCTAQVWFLMLGATMIFSTLFSKTHRVNKIMKNARHFKRIKVTIRDTLKPMSVVVSLNVAILLFMTIFDPVKYKVHPLRIDRYEREIETYGTCYFAGSLAFIIPAAIINVFVIGAALLQAWFARNLSTEFQESGCIFRAIRLIIFIICIGVPVIFLARTNPDARIFIASAIIVVTCMGILLLIFVPKMQYKEQNKSETTVVVSGIDITAGNGGFTRSKVPSDINVSYDLTNDDDAASYDGGERILTTKNQHELAEEVALLKKMLLSKKRREAARQTPSELPKEDGRSANAAQFMDPEEALGATGTAKNVDNLSNS